MKAHGFSAAARILTASAYQAAFAERKPLRTRFLSVHSRPTLGLGARLGLVVGKRQCPLANRRNLVKRLIRERFRMARPELASADLVFRLSARLPDCRGAVLKALLAQDLASIFQRLPRAAAALP